jgi:hypothetical protein
MESRRHGEKFDWINRTAAACYKCHRLRWLFLAEKRVYLAEKQGSVGKIFHTFFCGFSVFWDFARRKPLRFKDTPRSNRRQKNRA